MSFMAIVLGSTIISAFVPIIMIFQSSQAAWRTFGWAMVFIVPTLILSMTVFVSQGEEGFLSASQGIVAGSSILTSSFSVGLAVSKIHEAWRNRRQARERKPQGEDWSSEIGP